MQISQFPSKDNFCRSAEKSNVIPVCIEILADTETPVSLLKKLNRNQGSTFLLESVEGGERWGRYSFLGTSARCHVYVFKDRIEFIENGQVETLAHDNEPFALLRRFMSRYKPAQVDGLPRFWGGLVGYLTYETVSFIEDIPNHRPDDKPLAHFIIPDELVVFDNITNTLTAVAVVFVDKENDDPSGYERLYDDAEKRLKIMLETIARPLKGDDLPPTHQYALRPGLENEAYRFYVKTIKDYILAGDVIQTVISQPFVCDTAPDTWLLYRAQRYINPSPYLFLMEFDELSLVGSSPETMVRLEDGIANLRPIAGTRPRGKSEQEDRALADDLLRDEKERAEHLMLVDLGRNDLGRVAETGTVQVTDLMVVERYSHVMHLVSNIVCDLLPEYDAWDLLAATFPAGTLSGAPKIRAMEIIAELEKTPRGPYGGAVGYISFSGNMDMAITIRTACIENGSLIMQAGAGIVADSDPETERKESVNKAMAVQRALKLVQGTYHLEEDLK